jgi:hypothetical protein
MNPVTNGVLVNPAVNAILADTGPLPGPANHTATIIASSSVAMVIVLEYRDAANGANLWAHTFPIAAQQPFKLDINLTMNADLERLRVRLQAAIAGQAQVSILTD